METARVDIRKLQLLNDRISQCLDALAQVRLSVHGLSHSPGAQSQGFAQQLGGQDPRFAQTQSPFGQGPQFGQPQSPFGQGLQFGQPRQTPFFGGLSHTPYGYQFGPQQGGNWMQQPGAYGQQQWPIAQSQWNPMFGGGNGPLMQSLLGQIPGGTGLSHTGADVESMYGRPLLSDHPLLAARLRETFPYLASALPPFVSVL